jgi:UDP-glucose 4-epimerase
VNFSSRNPRELVIVYGANGFLGSVITKRLHKSGIEVLAVVRPSSNKNRIEGLKNLEVIEEESFNWPQLIEKYKPGAIICAQWRGVRKSDREDLEMQKSNIQLFVDLANATKKSNARAFICFGSQAEVKESSDYIDEAFYETGLSAYGKVKAELHSQLASLFEGSDCRFIWARVFSVYGPSDASDSLLMRLFEAELEGSNLVITNPSKFWSYLYEDDFASAVEQILKNPDISGPVNVGNPVLNQIKEIVETWQGSSSADRIGFESSQTNLGFFPKTGKLEDIGWKPSISLEEGIQRTRIALTERINPK